MWETLRFLVVVEAIGLAALPLTARLLGRLPGRGQAFARPLGLLLVAYPAWLVASLHLLPFGRALAVASVALVAGVGWRSWRGGRRPVLAPDERRGVRTGHVVFLATFALGALLAAYVPDVRGTEKPMDMAILAAAEASDAFPPHDPWFAGETLNYYYFGHYLMAFVVRIAGVEPSAGYNLALALLFSLTCLAAYALAWSIAAANGSSRPRLVGLAGAGLLAVAGTIDAAQQLFADGGPLREYDWWAPSRLFGTAITEFPAFSFNLGDLHAHVLVLPWTLAALAFGLQVAVAGPRRLDAVGAGIAVGALYAINSWSFPVTMAILALATVVWLRDPRAPSSPRAAGAWAAGVLWVGVLAYLPYWLGFEPPPAGIGLVTDRVALPELLRNLTLFFGLFAWIVVAGFVGELLGSRHARRLLVVVPAAILAAGLVFGSWAGVVVLGAAILVALRCAATRPDAAERFTWLLLAAGIGCVWMREVVFVRDVFDASAFERMNTIFKFDFQAWTLLSIAAAAALPWGRRRLPPATWRLWGAVAVALAALALAYPVAGTYARKEAFTDGPRITGLQWLRDAAPGDVAAIEWLREETPGDAVVVEAVGPDYSQFGHGRISEFSGRAAVMGWVGHEVQWGHEPGTRQADVGQVYTSPDRARVRAILDRYAVDYVVLGSLEQTDYGSSSISVLDALGERVLQRDGTFVWRVTRSERT